MKPLSLVLALVTGCAGAKLYSPQMHRELPPTRIDEFVMVDCQEFPLQDLVGCTYVGWIDGNLCASIVEAKGDGDWSVIWSTCDIAKVMVLVSEDTEIPLDDDAKKAKSKSLDESL